MLRLLFIWFGAVPTDTGRARRRRRGSQPLFGGKGIMTDGSVRASRDWLDSTPVGIVAALLLTVGVHTAIWTATLAWMGVACILNAQRCGRTHCRYTGPYYLAMILPVCILGTTALLEDSLNGSRWVFSLRSVADCCGGQQNAHRQVQIGMRVHPTRLVADVFPENHVSNVRKGSCVTGIARPHGDAQLYER